MPLYEYRCGQCGHELEVLQKLSAPAPLECPACHQLALAKKLSAAGFQLKGTGWYVTDFRGNGNAKAAAKPAEGAGTEGKTADANPTGSATRAAPEPATAALPAAAASPSGATSG